MIAPTTRTFPLYLLVGLACLSAISCATTETRQPLSDDEIIHVAVVGLNGRGNAHVSSFRKLPNVKVVALCDVDEAVLEKAKGRFTERGEKVDTYTDFQELILREDLHAVSLATPNHWHALQTVWACNAGLDVYVEKPVSHNFGEGLRMIDAARKHQRIVQVGTQSRSSSAIREAIAWMHEGHLGDITIARGFCYKPRRSIGLVSTPQPIPESVHYDQWLGPSPKVPLSRKRLHYDWHWDQETGNGDLGNQGVHQVDLCRWALGADSLPTEVLSIGGRLGYEDNANTPNTQLLWAQYAEAPMLFEVRGLPRDKEAQTSDWNGAMDSYRGVKIGVIIDCEKGYLKIPNYSSAEAFDADGNSLKKWQGAEDHFADFIAAVRSGDPGELSADIQEGHLSAAPCHLANISHQLGAPLNKEPTLSDLANQPHLMEAYQRMADHLLANQVDLKKNPLTLGKLLTAEHSSIPETLESDPAASLLLFRPGRGEFQFPE